MEVFLSLDGVRLSVVNQQQSEIVYLGVSRYVHMHSTYTCTLLIGFFLTYFFLV
jgi:hypothetical protein